MSIDARFDGANGNIQLHRPRPGVVIMTMVGIDDGELGRAPFLALEDDLATGPVEIFIDARRGRPDSAAISGQWAMFFHANRARIARVHMLTRPRFPQDSAELVRAFAILEDSMDLVTDVAEFERTLDARIRA